MPNSIGTGGTLSVPAIWSKYMALTLDAESVMAPLCNRSVEGDLASAGDTVHVQKWGNVSISSYVVASNNSVQTVSVTDQTLLLDQQKYFQFVIDDVEKALSQLDLVKGFSQRAMIAMAQVVDTRIFTHYADATNVLGSTTAPIQLSADNVYSWFVESARLLDVANVSEDSRVAVIDTFTKSLIRKSPDFIKNTATGDAVVRKGDIGELAGFRVVVSNRITAVTGTTPLMFFSPDFISLAMRISPDKFVTYTPELQFGTGVKGLALYGTKVFNPACGVTLYRAN